jgi:hypothetical protein
VRLRSAQGVHLSFAGALCIAIVVFWTGCARRAGVEIRFTLDAHADAVQILQFYVSEVSLRRHDGSWKQLLLTTDSPWQNQHVALLDLGAGAQGNRHVTGTVEAGEYSGIRFSVTGLSSIGPGSPATNSFVSSSRTADRRTPFTSAARAAARRRRFARRCKLAHNQTSCGWSCRTSIRAVSGSRFA